MANGNLFSEQIMRKAKLCSVLSGMVFAVPGLALAQDKSAADSYPAKAIRFIVPYKGAGPAALNVLTGECAMTFTSTVSVMPHVKAGRLRGVAVTTPKRDKLLPEIPAIAETIPGYDVSPWYGVLTVAGTPLPIVNKLHAETTRIVQAPDIAQRLATDGGTVVSLGPEPFARMIQSDRARWAQVVAQTGFRAD
jgi:tripartite-type tricarboxylate transporter receptor subunit TctC